MIEQNIYSIYNLIDESLKFGGYGLKYIHDYHSDDLNISEARLADREDEAQGRDPSRKYIY